MSMMNLEEQANRRAQQREIRRSSLVNSNPLIRNAILDDDQESGWLQNTWDGVINGVPAVAAAATLSFVNTGISLGNAFGADIEEIKTDDALRSLGLESSANYYNKHSEGVEAIGFIAGAIGGGGLAIKGLRALQKGYAISSSNRFISGLGRLANAPDEVMAAANQIRTGAAPAKVLTSNNIQLLGRTVGQYSLEGAAASYVPLLTQNNSPFLNKNDLGYFDSVKANFKDSTVDAFLISPVFGALGGVFSAGRLRKAVKEVRGAEQSTLSEFVDPIAKSMYSTEGDVVSATSREHSKISERIATFEQQNVDGVISETDASLTLPALKRLQQRVKIEHEKALQNLVKSDDADIKQVVSQWGQDTNINISGDLFAGAKSVTRVAPAKPTALPERVGLLDDVAEDLKGLDDTVTTENVLDILHGNKGFRSEVYKQAAREMDIINSAENKFASQILFKDTQGLGADKIAKHMQRMEAADRELNPAIWQEADALLGKYRGKDLSKLSKAERLKYTAERAEYMSLTSIPNQFQRVVASALGKEGVKVTRKYSDLFGFFSSNGHTAKYVNGNSLFVDTLTGNTFVENVLPTVGDYGAVKLTRSLTGKQVLKFGNYSTEAGLGTYTPATVKNFSSLDSLSGAARDRTLREMNTFAIESEAKFVAAQMDSRFNVAKTTIGNQDLPYLERALTELQQNPNLRAKVAEVGDLDATQLTNHIKETKQSLINTYTDEALLGKASWSQDQLERMLQVDQEFILSGNGNFIGMARDLSKPRHIKVNYGINLAEELPDAEARLASVRNAISENHKLAGVAAAREVSPTFAGVMSTIEQSLGKIDTDLTSVAPGYLTASYADYGTFASRVKYIGAALHKGKLETRQNVASQIIPLATTVAKNPKALQEANAIIERSRMGLYRSSEDLQNNITLFLNDVAGQLPSSSQLGNISKALGNISENLANKTSNGALTSYISKDLSDTVSTRINQVIETLGELSVEGANVERINSKLVRQMATFENDLNQSSRYFNDLIPIHSPEVLNWVNGHKQLNSQYIKGRTTLDNVTGKVNTYDPETLYLGNPSIEGKFVAFVESPNIVQTGTKRHILIADSAEELNQQVKVVNESYPEYAVYTSKEREAYAQAKANYEGGSWNFDPNFNAEMQRKGSVGKFTPRTDRSELEGATNSLIGRHTKLLTDSVETFFAEDMARLDVLASRLDNLYGGQVGNGSSGLNFMKNNPARATQNILRDRSTSNEFQEMAEGFVSGTIDKIGNAIKSVTTGKTKLSDQDFADLQEITTRAGYNHAPVKAVSELVMESNPPTEAAKKLISVVNGAAVLTMHRADTFMPILNALGNVVMGNAEYSRIIKSISSSEFPDWVIKNQSNIEISPAKALASAMGDVFGNMDQYLTRYESMGLNVRAAALHKQLREAFAEDFGNFTVNKIQDTMAKWGDFVSKVNGSNAIDDFNRAITARVADRLALQTGIAEGSLDHRAFIHNFVSNVEGTVISSQRPQLFNGVVGQAIGLFQSYSLHMGQSLFRNLADGNKRYALQVLSMNGTLFGANSLPGWQQVNQHLIDRSNSGGSNIQANLNDALGADLGDLITYGSVSNILQLGIYNRGRIDLPFINTLGGDVSEKLPGISILGRAVGAVADTGRNLAMNGFDGSYMLEGLSMIGINRPIAELAQIAQGYTLTRKGNVGIYNRTQSFEDYVDDKANWASLGWNIMGAAMGAKNLDSSIALDQYYKSYAATASVNAKLSDMGAGIKARVRAGEPIGPEDMELFMTRYVSLGKDKKNFDRWMINQMMSAKESQVNSLSTKLTTAGGLQMQRLMGGSDTNIYNSSFWE